MSPYNVTVPYPLYVTVNGTDNGIRWCSLDCISGTPPGISMLVPDRLFVTVIGTEQKQEMSTGMCVSNNSCSTMT